MRSYSSWTRSDNLATVVSVWRHQYSASIFSTCLLFIALHLRTCAQGDLFIGHLFGGLLWRLAMATGVEIIGYFLGVASWLLTGASLANDYWKISSFAGSVVISSRQYQNLWHSCAEASTGISNCRQFESMLALPGKCCCWWWQALGEWVITHCCHQRCDSASLWMYISITLTNLWHGIYDLLKQFLSIHHLQNVCVLASGVFMCMCMCV